MSGSEVSLVRNSPTPETFDGVWQVWVGVRCYGTVQKAEDPALKARAWGYHMKPTTRYPNGQRCMEGFKSAREAATHLVSAYQRGGEP